MSANEECPICMDEKAIVGQRCCRASMCLPCFEKTMCSMKAQCPFCKLEEPALPEPDVAIVKRRRIQVDEEWRPRSNITVPPRSSVRITRRTVYVYDFDSEEPSSVGAEVAEPSEIMFPSVVRVCDDEGVEESKGDN